MNTQTYEYPRLSILADLARTLLGVICTMVPVIVLDLAVWLTLGLSALGGMFLCFGVLTVYRAGMKIEVTAQELRVRGFPVRVGRWQPQWQPGSASIAWNRITGVSLNYYTTRSDNRDGWMQLTLRSDGRRIRLDSRLPGFDQIARETARWVSRNELGLPPATITNFKALGVQPRDLLARAPPAMDGHLALKEQSD